MKAKIGEGIKSAVGSEINKRKEKAEVMKAKAAKVKESVGGFFSKVGQGIKNVGGAIVSKHPAVMAAKAIKGKTSSSSGKTITRKPYTGTNERKLEFEKKRTELENISQFGGTGRPITVKGLDGTERTLAPGTPEYAKLFNSSPPIINKPNNSFSNMINSVSKKTEYEELEPVIITVPVLVKSGGGVVNQQSSSTTVASTGGGSGNDPFEVLDFQG